MQDNNDFGDQEFSSLEVTREEAHRDAPAYAQRTIRALRNIKGSLLANALAAGYEKKQMVSLIGQKIANSTDLAVAAQMYRNPCFETFRTFFVKQNIIVGQTGVTSRLPGSTSIIPPGSTTENMFAVIKEQMANLGAEGYYLMHNHPSGNLEASFQDINVTRLFSENIEGFLGHIIVNEKRYACLNPDMETELHDIADVNPEYDLSKPAKSSPVLNIKVAGPETIAHIGTEYYRKDYATLIGRRGTTGTVNGLAEVHVSELAQKEDRHLIALLRAFQRQTASVDLVMVNVPDEFAPLVTRGIQEGLLKDALVIGRGSLVENEGICPLPAKDRAFKNKVYEVKLETPARPIDLDDDQEDEFSPGM